MFLIRHKAVGHWCGPPENGLDQLRFLAAGPNDQFKFSHFLTSGFDTKSKLAAK